MNLGKCKSILFVTHIHIFSAAFFIYFLAVCLLAMLAALFMFLVTAHYIPIFFNKTNIACLFSRGSAETILITMDHSFFFLLQVFPKSLPKFGKPCLHCFMFL